MSDTLQSCRALSRSREPPAFTFFGCKVGKEAVWVWRRMHRPGSYGEDLALRPRTSATLLESIKSLQHFARRIRPYAYLAAPCGRLASPIVSCHALDVCNRCDCLGINRAAGGYYHGRFSAGPCSRQFKEPSSESAGSGRKYRDLRLGAGRYLQNQHHSQRPTLPRGAHRRYRESRAYGRKPGHGRQGR